MTQSPGAEDHADSPNGIQPASLSRRLWRIGRIARKELREALRDRRTLLTLVLMPLLVYPLLGTIMQKFVLQQLARTGTRAEFLLAFESGDDGRYVQELLAAGERAERALQDEEPDRTERNSREPAGAGRKPATTPENTAPPAGLSALTAKPPEPVPVFRLIDPAEPGGDLEQLVRDGTVDLGMRLSRSTGNPRIEVLWNPSYQLSRRALDFVRERTRNVNILAYRQRLQTARISDAPVAGLVPRELAGESTGFSLVTVVPLMLVLMTVTGAVYPAIDLTAGERERGTLEILVATPVPRLDLLSGKFVAVLAVAMLTAIVNLVALVITVVAGGLEQLLFGNAGLSVITLAEILLLLFVFAAFFSAVLLALTSFARSFKEAQAWLIPLMLLALAPGVLSLMPDVKMTGWLAVLPLVNIVLLGRDLLQHDVSLPLAAVAVTATVLYALLALSLAARVFGTDAILYGSSGGWSELLQVPGEQRPVPPLTLGTFVLAAQFPLFIVLGSLAGRFSHLSTSARLGINSIVLVVLFLLLPLLVSIRGNLSRSTTFRLTRPHWSGLLGALLLGVSLWPLVFQLEVWTLPRQRIEELIELFRSMGFDPGSVPLAVRLICLAAVPAICEEFFFRGFLQSTFRYASRPRTAVLLSSVAFALFHIVVRDSLLFERFLPSLLLGLVLGTVCLRTESLWPGMLLHVLHNSLVLGISDLAPWLPDWGFDEIGATRLPLPLLLGAVVIAVCGAVVLYFSRPRATFPVQDRQARHGAAASFPLPAEQPQPETGS